MKILHIDETFHPNYGYQCNPLAKFQSKQGHEVYIIAPEAKYIYTVYRAFGETGENLERDDKVYEDLSGVKIIRALGKGYVAGRLNYNTSDLYKKIESINPDVILVHCVETLTAIRVMRRYKNRYPMVFDSHMLSMATQNKFAKIYEKVYKLLVTSLIKKKKYTVIKTQNDNYVVSHLGVPEEQTIFISFGTDTSLFCPNESVRKVFLEEHNLPENSFVITSTGKLNEQKGGKLFAEVMSKKFNTDRPVVVVVVADFSGDYEKEVKRTLDSGDNKVIYYPVQKYTDLPKFYQIADVTVFPKQCSMSFYDAQSCGVPVISEKGNVNEDRNSHGNGLCFECGDATDFRAKLEQIMNMPEADYKIMRKNSHNYVYSEFSYDVIAQSYSDILNKEFIKFNKQIHNNKRKRK